MSPEQARIRHEFCQARRNLKNAQAELSRIEDGTASLKRLDMAKKAHSRALAIYGAKRKSWEAAGRPS